MLQPLSGDKFIDHFEVKSKNKKKKLEKVTIFHFHTIISYEWWWGASQKKNTKKVFIHQSEKKVYSIRQMEIIRWVAVFFLILTVSWYYVYCLILIKDLSCKRFVRWNIVWQKSSISVANRKCYKTFASSKISPSNQRPLFDCFIFHAANFYLPDSNKQKKTNQFHVHKATFSLLHDNDISIETKKKQRNGVRLKWKQ